MLAKINVFCVLRDRWATLRNFKHAGRTAWGDVFLFFVVPIIPAYFMGNQYTGCIADTKVADITLTSLSILVGLLLNLLVLIYGILDRSGEKIRSQTARMSLLKEVFANISYCVLICIVSILIIIAIMVFRSSAMVLQPVLVYVLANFILTMLMIVKRVHILLEKEFKTTPKQS